MGKTTTFVAEQVAKLMDRNTKGQVGIRNRFAEIEAKIGQAAAVEWLKSHIAITLRFRAALERNDWAVGDCEGTGVGNVAQMCELAFVRGCDASILFSSLLGTTTAIEPGAFGAHQISDKMIEGLPCFADRQPDINKALTGINEIYWYNGDYDLRVKAQTAFAQGIGNPQWPKHIEIMPVVGEWIGSWNPSKRGWRWPKLEGGHRAAGDCTHLIRYIKVISQSDIEYARQLLTQKETEND